MPKAAENASRIRLARVTPDDAAELIASHLESRDYHAPWTSPFTDQAGFDAWYWRSLTGPSVALLARETASDGIVGVFTLSEIVGGVFRSAYLGYHGMVRFARQGLMTEALVATAKYAFDDLGLHRLEANIQPDNLASITLVKRAGFQKEGYSPKYLFLNGAWRDHERWALLSEAQA